LADPALHAPAAGNGFFQGDVFFSSIKENDFFSSERGTISFLEEKKQKTLRERMSFGGKAVSCTSCLQRKNGRFTYEPSVLHGTLAEKATVQNNSFSADDFLLLLFF